MHAKDAGQTGKGGGQVRAVVGGTIRKGHRQSLAGEGNGQVAFAGIAFTDGKDLAEGLLPVPAGFDFDENLVGAFCCAGRWSPVCCGLLPVTAALTVAVARFLGPRGRRPLVIVVPGRRGRG